MPAQCVRQGKVRTPYFQNFQKVLAKITAKNQLTLPKSVTEPLGPVQYFDVQTRGGQIVLTPVRIQRGDALRAKLEELALSPKTLEAALSWAEQQMGGAKTMETAKKAAAAKVAKAEKPLSAPARKKAGHKKAGTKIAQTPAAGKTMETRKSAVRGPGAKPLSARASAAGASARKMAEPKVPKTPKMPKASKAPSAATRSVAAADRARSTASRRATTRRAA